MESGVYRNLFHSADGLLLTDSYFIECMIQFEKALASAQADCNIIPASGAAFIIENISINDIHFDTLSQEIPLSGNAAIPLIKQLNSILENKGSEKNYLHLGATSQDAIDTAHALVYQKKLNILIEHLSVIKSDLKVLIELHRNTVMIGRTLMQHAVPITFGLKAAKWYLALNESIHSLQNFSFHLTLGGAVGAGNRYINKNVRERVASILGLEVSLKSNASAQFATLLGILQGSISKIAKDISLLAQTEIAEVAEGTEISTGGSSTMPHKRNPVLCASIVANSVRVPHLVSTILSCMTQEHERSLGVWHAEWEVMKELVSLTSDSVFKTKSLISRLQVYPEKMKYNLDLTLGLIFSEKVSLALSLKMGKVKAHQLLEYASARSIKEKRHLKSVLSEMNIDQSELDNYFDYAEYVESSNLLIDEIINLE